MQEDQRRQGFEIALAVVYQSCLTPLGYPGCQKYSSQGLWED